MADSDSDPEIVELEVSHSTVTVTDLPQQSTDVSSKTSAVDDGKYIRL